jgi:hypothetical protein
MLEQPYWLPPRVISAGDGWTEHVPLRQTIGATLVVEGATVVARLVDRLRPETIAIEATAANGWIEIVDQGDQQDGEAALVVSVPPDDFADALWGVDRDLRLDVIWTLDGQSRVVIHALRHFRI